MIDQPKEIRIRLLLSIGCAVILASVYARALALASVFVTFSGMVRPWQNVVTDFWLFSLSATVLVLLAPVIRHGTRNQKILGVFCALVPFLVVGHFIVWLLLSYENWGV
jgi:hypothetical protein